MIEERTAVAMAADYGAEHLADLGRRTWKAHRFTGGWYLTAEGDDLRGRFGVMSLVVLDDGSIHEEGSSLPPEWIMDSWAERQGR